MSYPGRISNVSKCVPTQTSGKQEEKNDASLTRAEQDQQLKYISRVYASIRLKYHFDRLPHSSVERGTLKIYLIRTKRTPTL